MDDSADFKRQILECIRLAQECLRLAEDVQSPDVQVRLGLVAEMLVEAADQLRPKE